MVNVRLTEAIDVDATKAGAVFRALVDDPVMIDGKVVIPRSAAVVVQAVKVEQSGKIKGSDKISLKANSISFGGQTYEVVTAYVEAKGSGEGKRSAQEDRRRGWPWRHRRRHRGWRRRRSDWCRGRWGYRRRRRQPGPGTLEAAGRDPAAVPVDRSHHGEAIGTRETSLSPIDNDPSAPDRLDSVKDDRCPLEWTERA